MINSQFWLIPNFWTKFPHITIKKTTYALQLTFAKVHHKITISGKSVSVSGLVQVQKFVVLRYYFFNG